MNDFERLHSHVILRALASQLCNTSTENSALSKREHAGDALSQADCTRREANDALMDQLEDLIKRTSEDIVLERVTRKVSS
jgi:hypothetical protein